MTIEDRDVKFELYKEPQSRYMLVYDDELELYARCKKCMHYTLYKDSFETLKENIPGLSYTSRDTSKNIAEYTLKGYYDNLLKKPIIKTCLIVRDMNNKNPVELEIGRYVNKSNGKYVYLNKLLESFGETISNFFSQFSETSIFTFISDAKYKRIMKAFDARITCDDDYSKYVEDFHKLISATFGMEE